MPVLERDVPIYYECKGPEAAAELPLILAHGAGGNAAIWFNQLAHFSGERRVVAFDHRSFGRTPKPAKAIHVTDFRDDVLALMDALDIERAHLVGQSMGGFTVIRTVLDAPERVATVTMSATSGGIYNPTPTEAFKNLASSDDRNAEGVKATMSSATKAKPELMQLYESVNNFNVNFAWSNLATLLSKEDVVQHETLGQIEQPVLFIAGAEDPLFPAEQLAALVPHFPQAGIEIVTDSGHSPYFEQPDVFNRLLRAHITR